MANFVSIVKPRAVVDEAARAFTTELTSTMKLRPDALLLLAIPLASFTAIQAKDPLPSWNEGKAKQSITEFVAKVTKEGSPDFVPIAERIATFDNDGCLWSEQP